jgi:hypothetical protein
MKRVSTLASPLTFQADGQFTERASSVRLSLLFSESMKQILFIAETQTRASERTALSAGAETRLQSIWTQSTRYAFQCLLKLCDVESDASLGSLKGNFALIASSPDASFWRERDPN